MKSEHRHELKTNDLSRLVSDWGQALEQYVHQHTGQLAVVGVLVLAAIIGVFYWRTAAGAADSEGWRALANAQTDADLANVADKYAGTTVAAWARLREAERELINGIRLTFTSREAGNSDLKKAEESFEKVIADKTTPLDVRERALFGLATCREALPPKDAKPSDIDDRAIKSYERLLEVVPETVYKDIAESRIAALRTGTAQDFYAWFERQNPKPADREMPKDLVIPPLPDSPASVKPNADSGVPNSAPSDVKKGGEAGQKTAPENGAKKNADLPKANAGGASGKAPAAAPASK